MTVNKQEVVAEFYEAFNQHDIEGIEVHLAPEVHWTTAEGARERGRAAFQTYWQGAWAKNEIRIEPLQMETLGDKVHVRAQQVVTSPSGAVIENKMIEQIFGFVGVFISDIQVIEHDPNPDDDDEDDDA